MLGLGAVGVTACAQDDASALPGYDPGNGSASGGTTGGEDPGDGDERPLPPEEELEEDFEVPAAVGRYLWAANPRSNRVALVDAVTLEVEALEAGFAPTYLAGIPPVDGSPAGAVVLNALSHDATLFRLPADEDTPVSADTVTAHSVPVHDRANAWRVGPDSRFAIAWSNARAFDRVDPADGFQDLTVVDLEPDEPVAVRLSAGYRPSQVVVEETGNRAYVVSQPGITVLHLTHEDGPRVERELFLPEEASDAARDVSITPDGAYAFVRMDGESDVLIVDLATDDRVTVNLPAPVTDLDVSADGSRAVAVMRTPTEPAQGEAGAPAADEPSRAAILPLETIVADPGTYELVELDGLFGSAVLSEDGRYALLFTNGVPSPLLSVVDLDDGSHRELDLRAPVRAAFLTEDGSHAVVLLTPPAGSSRRGAFSLVPVADDLPPKLEGTDAPARFVAVSSDPSRALVTTLGDDDEPHDVLLARFPGLQVDRIRLASAPLASGIVPAAGQGFVAQSHPEGRVTFVDLEDGAARTLTGFELGGKVVE